jgi:hypothetical protein
MIFKLQPKVLYDFVRRLRRKSPPNLWQFNLAVREVIAVRTLRAMTGELSAAEARRMIEEKRAAAVRAHLAFTEAILNGKAASAFGAYFNVYQRAVESNRKRLSNRRWRWSRLRTILMPFGNVRFRG